MSERFRVPYVCPVTRLPLEPAGAEFLDAVRARIRAGALRSAGGALVTEPLDAAWRRADGAVFYPERGGIPYLVAEEAIEIPPELRAR